MIVGLIVWAIIGLFVQRRKNALALWRVINTVLSIVSFAGILHYTVIDRTGDSAHAMPFIRTIEHIQAQPELIREMIMNAFLFFPFGLTAPYALELAVKKNRNIILITILSALVLSGCIELAQRVFSFGNAELSDIVMNTMGAAIGSVSYIGRRFPIQET